MKNTEPREEDTSEAGHSPGNHKVLHLRARYLVGLGIVAVAVVLSQVWISRSTAALERDSRIVNIAGRQRMLSQRLAKLAVQIRGARGEVQLPGLVGALRESVDLFESSHQALVQGDDKMGLPALDDPVMRSEYQLVEPHFRAIIDASRKVIEAAKGSEPNSLQERESATAVKQILAREVRFLAAMDRIVFAHDTRANEKVQSSLRYQALLIALTAGVLLLVGVFVFEPSVRLILSQVAALESALATVKQLRGLLPICASCKKIRNDDGGWTQLESYIEHNSDAEFTHGICPDCKEKLYSNLV